MAIVTVLAIQTVMAIVTLLGIRTVMAINCKKLVLE